MPTYEAPGAIRRLPGETFASFSARQKASQKSASKPKPKRKHTRVRLEETYENRLDDLGESPDH